MQLKVFLTPASSADEALGEVKRLFPDQLTPPVVFVEWIASAPVEIELVAQLPTADEPAEPVELYDPPDLKPSPAFSRAALVRGPRQIFISGLSSRDPGDGETQVADIFAQLKAILAETGSDILHLAKATYYVSEDEASKALDKARLDFYPPGRAPAASKVTVHGVGESRAQFRKLSDLTIGLGDHQVRFEDVLLTDDQESENDGILGTDFLERFVVTLDFGRLAARLQLPSEAS